MKPKEKRLGRFEMFLASWPYGLLGKVCAVENNGEGGYTLWDKIRYRVVFDGRLSYPHIYCNKVKEDHN